MVYYRDWSMEQKEKKQKTSSTGKVKVVRETNTSINRKIVTYNVDVPISKSLSLN